MLWTDCIQRVVLAAISDKYPLVGMDEAGELIYRAVADLGAGNWSIDDPVTPSVDMASDIRNQVRCLALIDDVWRKGRNTPGIEDVYCAVYGYDRSAMTLRSEDYVEDFGGEVPTPHRDVAENLAQLNELLQGAPDFAAAPIPLQAEFLAEIFAAIIRAHPFPDGNGRTARMVVQYCLALWGRGFLVIPKIRNAPVWKAALEAAVQGDLNAAHLWFMHALRSEGESPAR